jgi:TRAP-type C4-dicarboxylate transport system substrate-binding protein
MVLGAMLVTGGCGGGKSADTVSKAAPAAKPAAVEKKYNWDFFIYVSTTHFVGKYFVQFADEVRQKSGGRLNITVRPEGEIPYKATEALRVVQNGNVQIADCNAGYVGGDSKVASMPTLPFFVTSVDELHKTWGALKPYVEKDFKKFDAEVILVYQWPGQYFWGKGKTVNSFDEFKGLKVRTYSAEQQEFLKRLGASPLALTMNEVPGAAQRGVIDALITSALSVIDNKMYDYLNWGFLANYGPGMNYVVVNSKSMADLPEDLRKILKDAAGDLQAKLLKDIPATDQTNFEKLEKAGMKMIKPAPEVVKKGSAVMADYYGQWGQKGGAELEEAMQKVRKALDK